MKTKIKLMALVAGLLSILPTTSAWGGGDSTTYYAALKASVSSSGGGKVYAGTSSKAETYAAPTSTSGSQSSTTKDEEKTFYAFAQADEGFEFAGWSTSDGGTAGSKDSPYSVTVKCSSSDSSNPTTTTVWANFKKKLLAAFGITFETSDAGTYTVGGGAPANMTGLTEATSVVLASSDPNFLNWKVNDAVVNDNPYTATCIADTTISAEFLTADQVAEATTYDELTAALANDDKKKITIPAGASCAIPAGTTFTVSKEKKLVIDGTLMVIGSIVNNGTIAGSGIIAYNAKTITQEAKVNVPYPAGTDGPAGTASGLVACDENNKAKEVGTAGKYLNTSTSNGATELTGLSLTKKYFVTVVNKASGETFTSSLLDSKPVAIVCTVARDKALNWISGMDGTTSSYNSVKAALDKAKTSSVSGVANYSDSHNRMAVLMENAGTVAYDGGGSSVTFGTIVDLAGKSLTVSASNKTQYNYHAIVRAFNGSISLSQKVMSTKFFLYNCTGSLGYLSGGNQYGTAAYLYDSPNYSVTFNDVVTDSPAGSLNFCGGGPYTTTKVKFQTTPKTKFNVVYAGTFVSGMDPTKYLWDDNKVEAVQDPSTKNWIVQDKYVDPNKGQTLVNGEEHSFVEAFEIAKSGDVIKLQRDVELEEDLNVASGKDVRLDLSGYALSGNFKIVNNGELEIIDCNNGVTPAEVNVPIVNNGTLLLSKAAYNGDITLNKGLCYFLTGSFNGDVILAADAVANEVAQVRGGTFAKSVYKQGGGEGTLLSLCENGYASDGKIAQIPNSYITGPGTAKKASFSVKALSPYLDELVNRVTSYEENRARYTKVEWIDLMTVRASSSLFANWNVDCGTRVDRAVGAGDLKLGLAIGTEDIPAISVGDSASVLLPTMRDSGYATSPWGYQSILPGGENESKVSFTVQGTSAAEGTSVWMEMRLVSSVHVSTQPKDWSYSGPYVVTGTRRFVVGAETNKAMVWGEDGGATFYSTLNNAVIGVAEGATIRLCNDCGENVTVGKVCMIDTNGFDFTGSIGAADGFAISDDGNGKYTVTVLQPPQPPVAKIGEVEYTDVFEAMARVKGGETIVLLADCAADFALDGWMLDTNGFAVEGAISVKDRANFWLKQTGNVYSAAPWAAQVGDAKYSSLANAVNAAKWKATATTSVTVVMLQDSNENVALPEGVIVDKNGHAFGGNWSLPTGYAAVSEGSTVRAEIGYAAVIGTAKYDTLKAAVAVAADGDAIRVVKDCSAEGEIVIAREITVNAGAFVGDGQLKADAVNGFAISVENGIYKVVNARVAQIGEDYYTSLEDAIDAVADVPAVITLLKSCDEIVVVGKACTFEIVAGDHEFTGDILAVDGYAVSVSDAGVWTVAKVESVVLDEEIVVKVGEGLVSAVTEEVVEETGTTDAEAVQAKLIEKIAEAEVVGTGLAKVSVEGGKKTIVKAIDAQEVTQQETGLYQATTLKNVDDVETVPVLNKEAEMKAVVSDTTKEKSLILAIPGETTVAAAIASEPVDGDTIAYYGEGGAEHMWVRVKGNWVASGESGEAESFPLPAGAAIRYVRSDNNDKPVTVVTPYKSEGEVKVEIKEEGWNVVANPNVGEPFDLNKITPTTAKVTSQELEKDKIVVPMGGQSERVYTYKNGQWGYASTEKVPLANGMTMLKKVHKTGDSKVPGGKGFWFFSSEESTKPTIQWREGAAK